MIDEKTRRLLMQVAGFLRPIAEDIKIPPAVVRQEASELLDKIGDLLVEK